MSIDVMHCGLQSIADLNMGLHLSSMLSGLTANVQQILESSMSGRKSGETHCQCLEGYMPLWLFV